MLFRKTITLILIIAMLTVTLGIYPLKALALTKIETSDAAYTAQNYLTFESDSSYSVAAEYPVTSGYTQINIKDLLEGTEGMPDTDEDGLPDDAEKVLGLDSEMKDTDEDNLDDYYEVTHGLDPLYPDTNRDGLADYYEILLTGEDNEDEMSDNDVDSELDTDGDGVRNVEDMDNDNDGVIDGVDISPFSYGEASDVYEIDLETSGQPTYVNVQIRPEDVEKMYENNQVYDWPYDTEGNIMDSDMTQDDMRILPMLEVETQNLPSEEECEKYGIVLSGGCMYTMLDPVVDRGETVAYSSKIFIPAGDTQTNLKIKMTWNLQTQVDNAAYRWEEIPSTYGGAKEYASAGAAAGDIDRNGKDDIVISGIEGVNDGIDRFYYAIGYDLETDGTYKEFSGMIKVPVDFPDDTAGSGVALANLDGDDKLDIICMAVKSVDGVDSFVYTIGYDIGANGETGDWTPLIEGPEIGNKNQGGGLSAADLDGNGKMELVFMAIDNPDGANHFRYTIRWNFDPDATGAYDYNSAEWSSIIKTNDIGNENQGGSIEVVNLDGDDSPDLLFTCVDNPDKENKFWYYVAWDINTDSSSSSRGEYSSFSDTNKYDFPLGYYSEGAGCAVGDFDQDGNYDLFLLNVDDPHGEKNAFWFWVGDTLTSSGNAGSFCEKQINNGIKGGLSSSLNFLDPNKAESLDCAIYDLDGNGIDDVNLVWIDQDDHYAYLTTGWDINEDGQVRGWQTPKMINYADTGYRGVGLDFYDVDNDGREDLVFAYYKDNKILYKNLRHFYWRGYYSYSSSTTKTHSGTLLDLSDAFKGITNLSEPKIHGVGIQYKDIDGNGKIDVVVSYNKAYAYYEVTKEETRGTDIYGNETISPEERRYYYRNENCVDVLYDVNIPNSTNDDFTFNYDHKEHYVLYTYKQTKDVKGDDGYIFSSEGRQRGVGIEISDLNGDDKLDALMTSAVDRGKKGEFYYLIQYDFLNDDSELQVRKSNDKDSWIYNDISIKGVGLTLCNFSDDNVTDAVAIIYDDEVGFEYYKSENIETKPVVILKEYDTFELIGIKIEENKGAEAGIINCDLVSTQDNDLYAMSAYEALRGNFLKDTNDISEAVDILGNDYDIDNITLRQESFDHADEVSVYIDDNTEELFEDATGTHVPIIVGITNESRVLTLDETGSAKVSGAYLSFNLADASYQTSKMLQLQWYNAEEDEIVDAEGLANGIDTEWGWGLSDDESKMNAIALLAHWQIGEINMTHIDNESILPEYKLWSTSWWFKTLSGGAKSFYDVVNYSRQGYQGLKVVSSIWKYKGGLSGFASNMTNYYKLMNGVRVTDANIWKLKNALDVDTFSGIRGKFTSGAKISSIAKWGARSAYAFDLGLAVYRGAEIGNAYASEGTAYSFYAGAVYTMLKGGYSTFLYMLPIISKLKYGAAGTGIGTIIVALIELSDLITFLACGEGWSTMVIAKIFDALVGLNADVEVDLENTSNDMTYEGMEDGMYVVGSTIENEASFLGTVEDVDDGHYDDKDDIDDNYAKPDLKYESDVDGIAIDNNKDVDTWYKNRNDLWWVYRDYDFDNIIEFNNIGINVPVTSVFNIYTKVHIHKKGPGEDYFETDSDTNSEVLYFDVMPTQFDEFHAGYNFDTSYEGGAETEPLDESKQRAVDNEIVIIDEDGDGLFTYGSYEINSDGDIVYSDPTKADTDGDGIDDRYEDAIGSDPNDDDTDGDDLKDRDEMFYSTDLCDSDTDGDGLSDKEELTGYNITVSFNGKTLSAHVHSDPLSADTDGDGISDAEERTNGTNPATKHTNGQTLFDGNYYAPSMKQELSDINDKSTGDTITIELTNYFEDLDGDEMIFTSSVGDLDSSLWIYTYGGGLVEVKITAYDEKDGIHEEFFVINDTENPYMSATYFNNNEANTDAIDGATGVYRSWVMRIEYNENIAFATVSSDITLTDEEGNSVVCDASITDNVLTVDPTVDLTQDGIDYTLSVPAGCIKDLNDNVTEQDYTGAFTTIDSTGPKVISTNLPLGDNLVSTPVVGMGDPVTYTFHESLRDYNYNIAFIGVDEYTVLTSELDNTFDSEAGTFTSYLKQDTLEDNTYYHFYPHVYDPSGNRCDWDYIGFRTGDVTSPDILLVPYYTGDAKIQYLVKTQSSTIEIPYDEAILDDVNFGEITLEDLTTKNLIKPFLSQTARNLDAPTELVTEIKTTDITTVPIDAQIVGNKLVITALIPLVPNCIYSLVIPKNAVKDVNGLSVLEQEEIHVTYDDTDAPKVYASGMTHEGEFRVGDDYYGKNTIGNIFVVYNEGIRKASSGSLSNITLEDSSGNDIYVSPKIIEWYDEIYGTGIGQLITLDCIGSLDENETYTLTIPAGTVENILGVDNELYVVSLSTKEFDMPGIEDETFSIIGNLRVNEKVYAHYIFERYNELFEGLSTYQWYSGSLPDGSNMLPIPGATGLGYEITPEDYGKYLFFEVTPVLSDGTVLPSSITVPLRAVQAAYSTNNGLSLLEVKNGEDVLFSQSTDILSENNLVVDSQVKQVTVSALLDDSKAHLQFYFEGMPEVDASGNEISMPLHFGENMITVTVSDERGTNFRTFSIIIERDTSQEYLFPPDGYCEIRPENYYASGNVYSGNLLYGDTYYYDDEKRSEGESVYRWYKNSSADGAGKKILSEGGTYTVATGDKGSYIFFEYTPVTESGVEGEPYLSDPVWVANVRASDSSDEIVPDSAMQIQEEDGSGEAADSESVDGLPGGSQELDSSSITSGDAENIEVGLGKKSIAWLWYVIGGVLLLAVAGITSIILLRRRRAN